MTGQYRTLFTGTLVQDSALSVGGNDPHALVDDPLCCDGESRFTLRGTTLAGALIATARKIAPNFDFNHIDDRERDKDSAPMESLWRMFNSHVPDGSKSEFRQSVGIRQDTGAAAEGALFDIEVLPRGTEWPFILEVETGKEGGMKAEAISAAALMEWTQGRCWIGRNVARGMGWLRLKGLKVYQLTDEHVLSWPDSSEDAPRLVIEKLGVNPLEGDQIREKLSSHWPEGERSWHWQEIKGKIVVGERDNDYGLDALSIGGHGSGELQADWNDNFLKPDGVDSNGWADNFKPDAAIVMSAKSGDEAKGAEPVIPGSSMRGPLRHALSRFLRQQKKTVRDPVARPAKAGDGHKADEVENLFGNLDESAALLIREAYVDGDWKAAWLQQHAEDEFSAGAYESSKFDRLALLRATFKWKMVIEGKDEEIVNEQFDLLKKALAYAKAGHLGLGGQQWRGLGWCKWSVADGKVGEKQE